MSSPTPIPGYTPGSLVGRLTVVGARIRGLHSRLGEPSYAGSTVIEYQATQTLITPNPKVTQIPRKAVGTYLSDTVQVFGDEWVVEDIPRAYRDSTGAIQTLSDDLVATGKYLLFATQNPSTGLWTGLRCDVEFLDRTHLTTWKAIVRPYRPR